MKRKKILVTAIATAIMSVFISVPLVASAGSFRAVPVRLYLDARTRTAVLKVTNDGDEKVTVQLEASSWSQDADGKDVYEPTKDIVFFPKIAEIEKGQEKIIRVGYEGKKGAAPETAEKTYRLFLQELPVSKPGEVAVKMAIRMGLPVFVAPVKALKEGVVEKMELSDGSLRVKVRNKGNSHIIISRVKAKGIDESGAEAFSAESPGWYVLAGGARGFVVDVAKENCLKAKEIKVEAEADKAVISGSLNVDKGLCADKPAPVKEGMKELRGQGEQGAKAPESKSGK